MCTSKNGLEAYKASNGLQLGTGLTSTRKGHLSWLEKFRANSEVRIKITEQQPRRRPDSANELRNNDYHVSPVIDDYSVVIGPVFTSVTASDPESIGTRISKRSIRKTVRKT